MTKLLYKAEVTLSEAKGLDCLAKRHTADTLRFAQGDTGESFVVNPMLWVI
ncbi:hypothetical protein JYT16_00030 [Gemmatimonas aurantiaca]|nr:hypothetical protein [Gemmatimonas aurantiaca]